MNWKHYRARAFYHNQIWNLISLGYCSWCIGAMSLSGIGVEVDTHCTDTGPGQVVYDTEVLKVPETFLSFECGRDSFILIVTKTHNRRESPQSLIILRKQRTSECACACFILFPLYSITHWKFFPLTWRWFIILFDNAWRELVWGAVPRNYSRLWNNWATAQKVFEQLVGNSFELFFNPLDNQQSNAGVWLLTTWMHILCDGGRD